MRILIFGAGVCGSTLAGFLAKSGVDVTILARDQRYEEIKQSGIILIDYQTKKRIEIKIPVINAEEYDENPTAFDFILAILSHHQVAEALPILARISPSAPIAFLGNNCSGPDEYIQGVGRERVLMGMSNVGGVREKWNNHLHQSQSGQKNCFTYRRNRWKNYTTFKELSKFT